MRSSFVKVAGEVVEDAILRSVLVTSELNQHATCVLEVRQTQDRRPEVEAMLGEPTQVMTFDETGSSSVAFDGFIHKARLEYELSGSYVVVLTAVSRSFRLGVAPRESYWRKKTLPDVAQALAAKVGITARVNCAGRPARNYVQWGEADFPFLVRIADDYHGWIRPTAEGIEIRDSFDTGPEVKWRTEGGLLSFKVSGKLGHQAFEGTHYSAYTMLSKKLEGIKGTPKFTDASPRFCDAVVKASSKMPSGQLTRDDRAATDQEYEELLRGEHVRALGASIVATGVSRVDSVRAGSTVTISGNLDAAGTYGVTKVVHRWTPRGYENEFWCTPWKQYRSPQRPEGAKVAGVISARVVSHNDEKKMGRLQVRYDWQEEGATAWARMATPHAGADRGFLFLPEIGDEVLVTFEQGDPERPFILGSLWNGVDTAPRQEFWGGDVEPNDIKRIVTKSGHRIQLSDTPGKESIVIATPSKLKVSLMEKTDETGRPMILLHAAEGDIVFNAPNGRIHFHSKHFSREIGGEGGVTHTSSPRGWPEANVRSEFSAGGVAAGRGSKAARLEKLGHAREMAMLSRDTYESHGAPLGCKRLSDNPKALPGDLKDFPFRDPSSGFDASLYEMQDGRIVIAYRGTEGHGDLVADVKQAFGFHSEQYDRAVELANLVKDQYPDKVIELTGHSLGGGLAAIASSTTGLPATTFNAASLHDRTLKRYGALPATEVTNYRLAGDPLSGVQDQSALSGGLAGLSTGSLTVAVIGGLIGSLPSAQGKQVDVPAVDSDGNTLSMNPKIRHSVNSFDGAFANQIKLETTAEDWRIP